MSNDMDIVFRDQYQKVYHCKKRNLKELVAHFEKFLKEKYGLEGLNLEEQGVKGFSAWDKTKK